MLTYSDIKTGRVIVFDDEPYLVVSNQISRKQQRKPQNVAKLKSLVSGKVVEHSFHASDTAEEADLDTKEVKYLYSRNGENWFCDASEPSDRFTLDDDVLGDKLKYVNANGLVEASLFEDKVISISIPIKVTLEVTEAPPNVKGNTASGGNKPVTLETGAVVTVPMFIEAGDKIVVNTETGEYTARA